MRIIPFGGAGEIGMNLLAMEHAGEILLVDCGLKFATAQFWGTDLVLPDTSWLHQERKRICAIVITHGHEDHIGALPFILRDLDNPPIYATEFTLELIRTRLNKHKCPNSAPLHRIEPRKPFCCGIFSIEAFSTAHSIPSGVGLCITTPAGCIIHSGDFKLDPSPLDGITTDLATLGRYADAGVLALLADSTNVERPGHSGSESDLRPGFNHIFSHCSGNVYVSTFSSNIHRIQLIVDAARKTGRKVVLMGRGLCENVHIARNLGLLSIDSNTIISRESASEYMESDKLCIIASGCQGESGSAMQRIAAGVDPYIRIKAQDHIIISARTIPGNEIQINSMLDQLYRLGATIHTGETRPRVHVSGHACTEELRQLLSLVKPHFFIPLHGEHRHLVQHAQLAHQCGVAAQDTLILRNGASVVLSCNGVKTEDPVPCHCVSIDMHNNTELETQHLDERKRMGRDGCVYICLYLPDVTEPVSNIHLSGINKSALHPELDARIQAQIQTILSHLSPEEVTALATGKAPQWEKLHSDIQAEIKKQSAAVCKKILGYSPVITVTIS